MLGRNVGSDDVSDGYRVGANYLPQHTGIIPLYSRNTAKQVETERAEFRKRMDREMRFGEQAQTGNSPGLRKLVPVGFADGAQLQVFNDAFK